VPFYADSSFFVSLYLKDAHSASALELAGSRPRLWLTPLHIAECFHAFAQQVYFGNITASVAERLYDQLSRDRAANTWREGPIPERAFERSAELARRYGPRLGVRTLDSLHVACALELKAERFWTFDERQAKLARAEGLKTQ
jgi:predicted nucleic acid-binding protein